MTIRTFIAANAKFGLCGAALLLSACGTQYTQYKERRADEAYQQALAANDLIGQRNALLLLTNADEDVSDYWIRLAKVELELGSDRKSTRLNSSHSSPSRMPSSA